MSSPIPAPLQTLIGSYVGVSRFSDPVGQSTIVRVWFDGTEGVVGSVSVNIDLERKSYELLHSSLLKAGTRASLRGVIELLGLVNTFLGRLETLGYGSRSSYGGPAVFAPVLPQDSDPNPQC